MLGLCEALTIISIHALLAESDIVARSYKNTNTRISIHALLAESDRLHPKRHRQAGHFYPRSPCGERPDYLQIDPNEISISIHALLAESDLHGCYSLRHSAQFLSTLSLRRATQPDPQPRLPPDISIHALLAESDLSNTVLFESPICISIHALLAESDFPQLTLHVF